MTDNSQEHDTVTLIDYRAIAGYTPHTTQPQVVFTIEIKSHHIKKSLLSKFDSMVNKALKKPENLRASPEISKNPLLSRIAYYTLALMSQAGFPVLSPMRLLKASPLQKQVTLSIPTLDSNPAPALIAITESIILINKILKGSSSDHTESLPKLEKIINKIKPYAPTGVNSQRFITAAHKADIPWRKVGQNTFQFGWGHKARWLDSSFTDKTPVLAGALVRDKHAASAVLDSLGIPVSKNQLVKNKNQALKAASSLGYPVVVKPSNLDGGRGVFPGLHTPEQVSEAYDETSQLPSPILVEKHFTGEDYRIQVFQGEVFWVTHRIPGGVFGNGKMTIKELLSTLNQDPERGAQGGSTLLCTIELNKEALSLIKEQGMTLETIPKNGCFVRLRRAANVSSGGTPVPIPIEQVHPDNIDLAIRVARLLRLDLAGIDLLIPDIKTSWIQSGASICEVNAQPQLYPHLPAYLLQKIVPDTGRIPIICLLGDILQKPWFKQLLSSLKNSGYNPGIASTNSLWINDQEVSCTKNSFFKHMLAIATDPSVNIAIIIIEDTKHPPVDLAFDKVDLCFVSDTETAASKIADDILPAYKYIAQFSQEVTISTSMSKAWPDQNAAPLAPEELYKKIETLANRLSI
ncbi:MAG: acetate--CoA ligase family protein [Marinobacterium sp.]|nr:acetate--CoA ligase family protein [Marinobacterium sp.]